MIANEAGTMSKKKMNKTELQIQRVTTHNEHDEHQRTIE